MSFCPLRSSSAKSRVSGFGTRSPRPSKKGMWMGGWVPIGYDRKDRSLTINETEALTVRTIFDLFLKLKNVQRVQTELMRLNLATKPYATPRGRAIGGLSFARGHIYKIL